MHILVIRQSWICSTHIIIQRTVFMQLTWEAAIWRLSMDLQDCVSAGKALKLHLCCLNSGMDIIFAFVIMIPRCVYVLKKIG